MKEISLKNQTNSEISIQQITGGKMKLMKGSLDFSEIVMLKCSMQV